MILACIGQRMQPYFCKDIPSAIIYLTSYRRYSHSAPLERERDRHSWATDMGISIVRDVLSPSLFAQLIVIHSLDPAGVQDTVNI